MQYSRPMGALMCVCVVSFQYIDEHDAAGKVPESVSFADVEEVMKSLSNWGRWGKDDELGALNLITAWQT